MNYKEQHAAIESTVIGMTTENGILISGRSKHFIDRVIGTMEDPSTGRLRSGVSVSDILDALQHPLKIRDVITSQSGKKSQKFIGAYGTASINPETGQLIQCNPAKTELREGLMKDGKQ